MNESIELCQLSYRNRNWRETGREGSGLSEGQRQEMEGGTGYTRIGGSSGLRLVFVCGFKNCLLCSLIVHMSTRAWLERTAGPVSHQKKTRAIKLEMGEEQEGILVHKHKNPTCKQNRFDCKMTTIKL